MKKAFLFVLTSLFVLGYASAGGSQARAGGTSAGEKMKIQLWHYWNNVTRSTFEELVIQYNARSDVPIDIELQHLPRNELLKRYTLGVVSNDLPEIGMIDNPDSASFAAMGMWLDITDKMKSLASPDFLPGPLNSGSYKAGSIPFRSGAMVLDFGPVTKYFNRQESTYPRHGTNSFLSVKSSNGHIPINILLPLQPIKLKTEPMGSFSGCFPQGLTGTI
jgi:ABC-type glycerol-3-phosphate transport system substrate-binding protein